MAHVAYILKSEKDSKYYYGSASDLMVRLKRHNMGEVRVTKRRRPFVIHYFEEFPSRSEAFKREKYFKSTDGYSWLKEMKII